MVCVGVISEVAAFPFSSKDNIAMLQFFSFFLILFFKVLGVMLSHHSKNPDLPSESSYGQF